MEPLYYRNPNIQSLTPKSFPFGDLDGKCTVVQTDSHRAVFSDLLEVKRGMSRV
jgi:hypothetical protein